MPRTVSLDDIVQPSAVLFGARLKERRKSLALTQAALFDRTGITPSYLSNIENGRANPTLDMMVKLSEAIGLEIWDMLRPDFKLALEKRPKR